RLYITLAGFVGSIPSSSETALDTRSGMAMSIIVAGLQLYVLSRALHAVDFSDDNMQEVNDNSTLNVLGMISLSKPMMEAKDNITQIADEEIGRTMGILCRNVLDNAKNARR